jgi:type II secretory pathway component GspD/PulD (secretin)
VPVIEDTVYVDLVHVRAATARAVLPQNLQRHVRIDEDLNRLAVTAPRDTLALIREHLARMDVARAPGTFEMPPIHRTHIVKLNHTSAEAVLAMLPPALHDYVRADEESSTLAISVPPSMLAGVLADVQAIDVPRRHVMLDARVVVLARTDLLDFGGEWNWPTLTAGTVVGDAVKWPWELRIGYTPGREFTQALSLTLNLLTANQEGTIIASPQVMAQDGREAEIRVTTEEWFQITSDVGTFLRADLREIETGTILGITPRIGRRGDLTLEMNIEVSDVIARGQQGLPVVSRRTARSTFQIENGGTAAVAGLVDTRSQVGTEGVPVVSNIPLLGHAFRTDTLNHVARQVAVFVTATVVGQGDAQFETGRRRPPAVAAELDEALFRLELESVLDQLPLGKH